MSLKIFKGTMGENALAHCKVATCRTPIFASNVFREKIVEESPNHIVVIWKCPACGMKDRMVGTIESWKGFKSQEKEEEVQPTMNRITKGAEIEMSGIDSVDDLITLWRSYKNPPLREAVLGSCHCDECKKRRFL